MTYRLSHIALAALATLGASTSMATVTAVAAMDGDLQASRLLVDIRGVPAGPETGHQLWLAVMHHGQLFFLGGDAGFVPFQCPGACDAPAYRASMADPQQIALSGWDVRSMEGAKIYVGWGRSFSEMVNGVQILEVHTVTAPSTDPMSLAYSGLYQCGLGRTPTWIAKADVSATGATVHLSQANSDTVPGTNRWFGVRTEPVETLNAVEHYTNFTAFYAMGSGVRAQFYPASQPGDASAKARMELNFTGQMGSMHYFERCEKL